MVVTIHQPQYVPYLGFFHKAAHSDVFVVLDDVHFQKGGFHNRNRIKTHDGWQWLTVPVLHKSGQAILDVQINNEVPWQRKHWNALTTNYASAHHFEEYRSDLQLTLDKGWERLGDLNLAFMQWAFGVLGIDIPVRKSSSLGITAEGTERLVQICKEVGGTAYLSGPGGKQYMDLDAFEAAKIDVIWQEFDHPSYDQQFPGTEFIPNLSVLDPILNCGPSAAEFLE